MKGKYGIIICFSILLFLVVGFCVKKEADWIQVISKEYHPGAYQKRNAWMVNKASKIIALCNGEASGTLNTVRYAEAQKVSVHMIQV